MRPFLKASATVAMLATLAIQMTAGPGSPNSTPGFNVALVENFDGVAAPNLPAGWTATLAQGQVGDAKWITSVAAPYSAPNAAFAPDVAHVTDNLLDTPIVSALPVIGYRTSLVFWHSFAFETGFDGGVVEIKIGAGAFTDIVSAGGMFLNGGYGGTISASTGNPLGGRAAFTGNSGGYIRSLIRLPPAAHNQSIQLRFRLGTDTSVASTGWRIDNTRVTIEELGEYDFNGDWKSDRTIFRPTNNVWYTALNGGGSTAVGWGTAGDIDVSADYDEDGTFDVAVWRPSTGTWFIVRSGDGGVQVLPWGQAGDVPMAATIECCSADAKADPTIWRPSNGTWYIYRTLGGAQPTIFAWGTNGDQPLVGDYIGAEWFADAVIYRPSTGVWYILADGGTGGTLAVSWGMPGDVPVSGDFDGDGRNDIAIFRPSSGQWWVRNSHYMSTTIATWGTNGDIPVAGDFNGDGASDFTVWRPSNGVWYTLFSNGAGTAVVGWGVPGDVPVGRRPGT